MNYFKTEILKKFNGGRKMSSNYIENLSENIQKYYTTISIVCQTRKIYF